MKRIITVMALCTVLVGALGAQSRGFGVGVIVGYPTGVCAKMWMTQRSAMQFSVSLADNYKGNRTQINVDYVLHDFNAIRSQEIVPVYYGIGGTLTAGGEVPPPDGSSRAGLGVRGVLGVSWLSRSVPIDVFLEVAPTVMLLPTNVFGIDAGLGIRFFFG